MFWDNIVLSIEQKLLLCNTQALHFASYATAIYSRDTISKIEDFYKNMIAFIELVKKEKDNKLLEEIKNFV